MNAGDYLIKRAVIDPLGFMLRRPLSDPPPEFTRDDERYLWELLGQLPPSSRRTAMSGVWARRKVGG